MTNTGTVAGADVPQLYLTDAAGEKRMRLLGFERVELAPGASRTVTVTADPRLLARFDGKANQWRIAAGTHHVALGRSAGDLGVDGGGAADGSCIWQVTPSPTTVVAARRASSRKSWMEGVNTMIAMEPTQAAQKRLRRISAASRRASRLRGNRRDSAMRCNTDRNLLKTWIL